MHVVHQEDATRQARERALERRPIEPALEPRRGALEAVEHAGLVALGLQAAEEPGAAVREPLVVEVDRVLRREHDAEPVGPRLLQQRQHRRLATAGSRSAGSSRRSRPCRGSRAGCGARLRPHPGHDLVRAGASRRTSARRRRDGRSRGSTAAAGRRRARSMRPMSSGSPFIQAAKPGEASRLFSLIASAEAILRREERLEVDDADACRTAASGSRGSASPGRGRALRARRGRGGSRAGCARGSGSGRRRCRAGRAGPRRPTRMRSRSASSSSSERRRRRGERAQDRERQAGVAARRVERALRGAPRAWRCAPASWPHFASPLRQSSAVTGGVVVGRLALARGRRLVDPGPEVGGREIREGQQQVAQVALRVDRDGRDAVDRRLLEQRRSRAPSCRCPSCRRSTACVVRSFES